MIYTCDSCHAIFEALAHPRACPACSGRFVMRHWKVWDGDAPIQMADRLPAVRDATILEQSAFLQSGFATLQEIRCLDDDPASSSLLLGYRYSKEEAVARHKKSSLGQSLPDPRQGADCRT